MTLTKEQMKEARQFCKANGIDPKKINKEIGYGFWMEECNGTLEGYLNWTLNYERSETKGETLRQLFIEGDKKSPVKRMFREVKENTFG